jgi:hypothetical protein
MRPFSVTLALFLAACGEGAETDMADTADTGRVTQTY